MVWKRKILMFFEAKFSWFGKGNFLMFSEAKISWFAKGKFP
jgi:hypothetical protein